MKPLAQVHTTGKRHSQNSKPRLLDPKACVESPHLIAVGSLCVFALVP